jgi:glutamate-ammonia-ligase adenylyltransferase
MNVRDLFLSPDIDPIEARTLLRSLGFKDPERADQHLQDVVDIVQYPERVADVAPMLLQEMGNSVDADAALRHFESFLEVVPSPTSLLSDLKDSPRALGTLVGLLGASPYLTQSLCRNPEYFYWLIDRKRLETTCESAYFQSEADRAIHPFDELPLALNALRRMRRREFLRIGAQDILGYSNMRQTVSQVSWLAETLLQKTFEVLALTQLPSPEGFTVLGMGKLGGSELNFSSDVDVIFLYEKEDDRDMMLRFARNYFKALTEYTSEGHLFRVDLRLRPMGERGEIAYSEKASHQYYSTWADTTDRLALLKCRPVAGDLQLGKRFVNSLGDFVYKKYLDHAAVEEIGWLKKRTDEALRRRGETLKNVKLGLGGIREIEFFVQAFQILYGGTLPELRTSNTLAALRKLVDGGFIEFKEFEALSNAYIFLRDLEHKLQLVHDLQTHSLPDETAELLRCSRRMGYRRDSDEETLEAFRRDLEKHSTTVRKVFNSLFQEPGKPRGLEELVLNSALSEEEALARLRTLDIQLPSAVLEGIRLLQKAPAFPHSPSRLRNLLANLVPHLVEKSQELDDPRQLFTRFDRFCESLGTRAGLYAEVIENQSFAKRLLTILSYGSALPETLIRYPELLESVVDTPIVDTPICESHTASLQRFLDIQASAEKPLADLLGQFKQHEEFKIGVRTLLEGDNLSSRLSLSELAETCLRKACETALDSHPALRKEPFCLIALGKLGGRELVFHSDLDLVFVFDDRSSEAVSTDFGTFLRELRALLQTYTGTGRTYELDFRLRPEGRHSAEAVPLSHLEAYFTGRGEPWERLAYVKARSVFENELSIPLNMLVLHSSFTPEEVAQLNHVRWRKEKEIGREENSPYYDLKVGHGALLDIQFVTQYLQIQHDVSESNTLSALDKLESEAHINSQTAETLRKGLRFVFRLEMLSDLLGKAHTNQLARDSEKNRELGKLMCFASGAELVSRYEAHTGEIRKVYEDILGPLDPGISR